jgi:tRNA-dihydrouridine synthase 3
MTTGEATKVEVDPDHLMQDSDVAVDSNGAHNGNGTVDVKSEEPSNPNKRIRTNSQEIEGADTTVKRVKGVAPIKAEFATPPT